MAAPLFGDVFRLPAVTVTPTERLVLACAANWCRNDEGRSVRISVTGCAAATSLSRRAVQKTIGRLVGKGLLEAGTERHRRGVVYYNIRRDVMQQLIEGVRDCDRGAQSTGSDCERGAQSSRQDCAPDAQNSAPGSQICEPGAPYTPTTPITPIEERNAERYRARVRIFEQEHNQEHPDVVGQERLEAIARTCRESNVRVSDEFIGNVIEQADLQRRNARTMSRPHQQQRRRDAGWRRAAS